MYVQPIPHEVFARKGARDTASVPPTIRNLLNQGAIETVNLCEWLIVDQATLAGIVFSRQGWSASLPALHARFAKEQPTTAPKKIALVGQFLAETFPAKPAASATASKLRTEASDLARAWGAWLIGASPTFTLQEKLKQLRPFADDPNMSVREITWLALRHEVIAQPGESFQLLAAFTKDREPNLRRFASELTRPRGVWCAHIKALKEDPTPGLSLLEPLRADPSKYVRDSVANWLNDASKSHPDWVAETCARWDEESPLPETRYIINRAMRTLRKQ